LTRLPSHRAGVYLTPGHRTDYHQRFGSRRNRPWQWTVGRLVRQVLLAGVEPYEWAAFLGHLVADCPPQRGISRLEGVQHCSQRDLAWDIDLDLPVHSRQRAQRGWEEHAKRYTLPLNITGLIPKRVS
jgi:hypothetical protein